MLPCKAVKLDASDGARGFQKLLQHPHVLLAYIDPSPHFQSKPKGSISIHGYNCTASLFTKTIFLLSLLSSSSSWCNSSQKWYFDETCSGFAIVAQSGANAAVLPPPRKRRMLAGIEYSRRRRLGSVRKHKWLKCSRLELKQQ